MDIKKREEGGTGGPTVSSGVSVARPDWTGVVHRTTPSPRSSLSPRRNDQKLLNVTVFLVPGAELLLHHFHHLI